METTEENSLKELLFELHKDDAIAYHHQFECSPAVCECGHKYNFWDRMLAAIKLSKHSSKFMKDVLKQEPKFMFERDGKIYCPDCDKIYEIHMHYHYPNNMD